MPAVRSGSSAPTTPGESRSTRGFRYELPFGLNLYERKYSAAVQTSELGPLRREAVTGHSFRSKEDATSLIEDIESNEGS